MRVLVTGAGGLVGTALTRHCARLDDEVIAHTHQSLDISNAALVEAALMKHEPEAVINCAAWTDVDGCELDPDRAMLVNSAGPENLARASRKFGTQLITISTDYVFDGTKEGPYTQRDDPNPTSVYGLSKLEGERKALLSYARTIVVRSGFIFGPGGKNFLSTVGDRLWKGEHLKAINDSWGTPTYALDLAVRLRELAVLDLPGIFHVVNGGAGASYEEFARLALEALDCREATVEGLSMDSLKRPAARPRNSRLKCLLSDAIGLAPLREWQYALMEFLALNRSLK